MTRDKSMKIVTNAVRHAGGIWKWGPMLRSRVLPCLMKSVPVCAIMVLGMIVAARIGIIFTICFVSSTCVTGHSSQGESRPVYTAALSRMLQQVEVMYNSPDVTSTNKTRYK